MSKIAFHVRKESKILGVSDTSDSSIDTLVAKLVNKYKEYESYPVDTFKTAIKSALNESLPSCDEIHNISLNKTGKTISNSKVMNLNQTISLAYSKSSNMNSSVKRQRIIEDHNDDADIDSEGINTWNNMKDEYIKPSKGFMNRINSVNSDSASNISSNDNSINLIDSNAMNASLNHSSIPINVNVTNNSIAMKAVNESLSTGTNLNNHGNGTTSTLKKKHKKKSFSSTDNLVILTS